MMTAPRSYEKKSDFSIDHILNRAGCDKKSTVVDTPDVPPPEELSWLQCTRYCPPKLPRTQKREGPQKRQLGRHPRIPFSSQQLSILEEKFKTTPYLSSSEVTQLSRKLQLADVRVKIWFQNRRARERREKNEQTTPKPPTEEVISGVPGSVVFSHGNVEPSTKDILNRLDFRNINCLIKREHSL